MNRGLLAWKRASPFCFVAQVARARSAQTFQAVVCGRGARFHAGAMTNPKAVTHPIAIKLASRPILLTISSTTPKNSAVRRRTEATSTGSCRRVCRSRKVESDAAASSLRIARARGAVKTLIATLLAPEKKEGS